MRRMSLLFANLTGLLATCASLHAAEVPLIADTYISSTSPNTNYGSGSILSVGAGDTAFVRFDLSTLPVGVTSTQIARATLIIFVNHVSRSGVVSVSPVSGNWAESTATYATRPATGSQIASFTTPQGDQYVAIEITATAQGWVSNPASNLGLALNSSTANFLVDSKENTDTSHPSRLDITITSMGPQGPPGPKGPAGPAGGGVQSITAKAETGSAGGVEVGGSKSAPEIIVTFPPGGGVTKSQAVTAMQQAVAYGSGISGKLLITSDEDWTKGLPADANGGILQYTAIVVDAGATLTIPSGLTFLSTGTVDIEGTISVEWTTGNATLPFLLGPCPDHNISQFCELASSPILLSTLLYPGFGGGAGSGSNLGGGALVIRAAGTLTIGGSGSILADGQSAPQQQAGDFDCGLSGGGGAGGGIVVLASQTEIFSLNLISVKGGSGSNASLVNCPSYGYGGGGGGGGGVVHLLAPRITRGTVLLTGGSAGESVGNMDSNSNFVAGEFGGAMGGGGGQGGVKTASATAGGSGLIFESTLNPTVLFNH